MLPKQPGRTWHHAAYMLLFASFIGSATLWLNTENPVHNPPYGTPLRGTAGADAADAAAAQSSPPLWGEATRRHAVEMQLEVATHCYTVQAHACSHVVWAQGADGVHSSSDAAQALRVRLVPGLWPGVPAPDGSGPAPATYSLQLCEAAGGPARYLTHDGCSVSFTAARVAAPPGLEFSQSASFVIQQGRYYKGFYSLEAANSPGRFVGADRAGLIGLEGEDGRVEFREKTSWMLSIEGAPADSVLPVSVFLLRDSVGPEVKANVTFDPGFACSPDHRGCCAIPTKPAAAHPRGAAAAAPPASSVAAVIISSKATIGKRRALLDRVLLNDLQRSSPGIWKRAVISVECLTHHIDTTLRRVDWVVGPRGSSPQNLNPIALRVASVLHWTFERYSDLAWYFMIDDDTLVFSDNLQAALGHFPNPFNTLWYVGRPSEWKIKKWFHGNMAFGGGGVLISNRAGRVWSDTYTGDLRNASRRWVTDGRCSAVGGDGMFCRSLKVAGEEQRDPLSLTVMPGLHQFDIVGTDGMLDLVRDTCPHCPTVFEQTGLWLEDIVSRDPVITLHHILAVEAGSVFPGMDGPDTQDRILESALLHHHLLFLRRLCGKSSDGAYTVCLNFGLVVKVYRASFKPEDALLQLETSDGSGRVNPTEELTYMSVKAAALSDQICSLHYNSGRNHSHHTYIGMDATVRPRHSVYCKGGAEVVIGNHSVAVTITLAAKGTIRWTQSLTPLLDRTM